MATILIVDDRSANREFLVTLLGHHGHRLMEAPNGREGLLAVQAARPDLVITDVLMPVMDGYEFVKRLRLDPATSDIPVLFYTAPYGEREARAFARSSGLPYVLTKPCPPEEVVRIVSRVLAGAADEAHAGDEVSATPDADRDHLRLLTNQLSESADDLKDANARLRALINIGLDLASSHGSDRLMESVCDAACDLFGASYVTLGILDRDDRTVRRFATCGTTSDGWITQGDLASGILQTVMAEGRTLRGENPGGAPATLDLPAGHPQIQAFLAAPISSRTHVHGWICLVCNEGRPFSERDEPMLMALAGHVGRIYELEYEILERKQAESAVRHERDRAQQYLDAAEVILLALDPDGRITLINRNGCDLLGWTESELLGREWGATCLPARLRDDMTRTLHKVLNGDISIVENAVLTRSGQERLIEWRNTVLRDDAGVATGMLSSGTDITVRTRAEEAQRISEARMRFVLQSAGVGIWDIDYRTGVLRWSEVVETQYGLPPGSFGGTFDAFIEHVHPEDRAAIVESLGKVVKTGGEFSVQNRSIWPDGTVRWLNGLGRILLDDQGAPVRGVGISLDITEQRELGDQLRQSQKLDAVGQLAGGVAHDFNNLLTAILGFSELALSGLSTGDPLRADILEIKKAGERAAGLIRQLLAFSRKQILQPLVLNINTSINGTESMLKRLVREDIDLALSLKDVGLIKMDPTQLEQILVNLVINAADAMPLGGRLTVETGNVTLDHLYRQHHLPVTPGDYVMLAVSDTGVGMDAATSRRIFEPFFTTKGVGKGTGLGLATVYGIVKQSGGDIWVYSELGHGTTFKIYLPQVTAGAPAVIERVGATDEMPRGSETILLVEDEPAVRQLARVALGRAGYRVFEAGNARDAMRVVHDVTGPIHLLLSDVIMPESEGPLLFDRLVTTYPGLRILYMSGYADEAIVRHGVLEEGVPFLQKPFTPSALARKVRDVLETVMSPA